MPYAKHCKKCGNDCTVDRRDRWDCPHCQSPHLDISPHPGPQTQFLESPADICIFGGARGGGKSFCLLIDAARPAVPPYSNAAYGAVLLRRTFAQVTQQGGLKDASDRWYPHLGGVFNWSRMEWEFPSGAKVKFGHLEHERDKEDYLGAEIAWIGFDELNMFTESQFWYLSSSNRSTCGIPCRIRATCNPDSASWVARFIEWWIDPESGYPILERSGVLRWFVRDDNQLFWADTPEELSAQFPGLMPKSATFIPALLTDNPTLLETNPQYLATLQGLPKVERDRFLYGNWLVTSTEGSEWEDHPEYFERHIWTKDWPDAFSVSAMFCDPSKGKTDKSDYSAIVFVGLSGGKLWIKSDIRRRPAEVITSDFVRLYHEWKPTFAGMESNVFQDLFGDLIDKECQNRGLPPLPLLLENNSVKKEVRIRALGPYLSKQKFLLHRDCESNKLLYGQLKDFGIADYDDGPDALEGAIGLLQHARIDPLDGDEVQEYGDDSDVIEQVFV